MSSLGSRSNVPRRTAPVARPARLPGSQVGGGFCNPTEFAADMSGTDMTDVGSTWGVGFAGAGWTYNWGSALAYSGGAELQATRTVTSGSPSGTGGLPSIMSIYDTSGLRGGAFTDVDLDGDADPCHAELTVGAATTQGRTRVFRLHVLQNPNPASAGLVFDYRYDDFFSDWIASVGIVNDPAAGYTEGDSSSADATGQAPLSPGDILRVERVGTSLVGKLNGSTVVSVTLGFSGGGSGTRAGFTLMAAATVSNHANTTLDDWTDGDLSVTSFASGLMAC